MARKLLVGETAYVPCSRVDGLGDLGVALYRTEIVQTQVRKVKVHLRDGTISKWIGASLVHRDVGILVLNIGDFESEQILLDPLAKSVTQFCKLLVPDDQIRSVRIRSKEELLKFWRREQAVYSHVIWVGHGRPSGLKFGVDGWVTPDELATTLRVHGAPKKTYIFLTCQAGYKSFGSILSKTAICKHFMGPFNSVDGAVASQFCQTFLTNHLIEGRTEGVAFRDARSSVPGSASCRLWNSGHLKAGQK